jgi:diguanylate cyclase (GGDEF)-like protein
MSGYALPIIAAVIGIIVLLSILFSHTMKKERGSVADKEIILRDNQIKKLNTKISNLSNLNSRYLSFILKVPSIIQRLHSSLSMQEIAHSIAELVRDVVTADVVEIYLFDAGDNRLKKVSFDKDAHKEEISFALGEDIVGIAAEHRFIMMRDQYNKMHSRGQETINLKSRLSVAVPIIFRERLLGVIATGEIENPVGSENDLLRMIADISSSALINRILLNEAQHKANTDQLTGLRNRNYLEQIAEVYMEKAVREGTAISVILFDIDNFKNFNDTNGHSAGDALLIELSGLLNSESRKEATICRFGGEEFIILLPRISKEDAFTYADRLRKKISQHSFPFREAQPLGFVSISGGVASFPEDGGSIEAVIQKADKSLYQAKSEGRNRVLLHTL